MTTHSAAELAGGLAFSKLEALGNDFMLVDARSRDFSPSAADIRTWADRRCGVGFDQLLILREAHDDAVCRVEIRNADGSEAEQCGNGMRAVALWLNTFDSCSGRFGLDTAAGPVDVDFEDEHRIAASLGRPDFSPTAVGLNGVNAFPWTLDVAGETLSVLGASLGNPHLLVVEPTPASDERLESVGRALGQHPALRRGANIGLACVRSEHRVDLRVFERGVGPTRACGSGATAAAAILIDQGVLQSPVEVVQPGGTLVVNWPARDRALSTAGPARQVFEGVIPWPTHPK
jgi:diaminopimelate epimerase